MSDRRGALHLYSPLNKSRQTIRLLDLQQITEDEQPIKCTLTTVELGHNAPSFVAFSYVWGTSISDKVVYVDEQPFQVTTNLYDLLKAVASSSGGLLPLTNLWIGAICINQTDHEERAHQVLLMKQIYRMAESVMIWLGDASDDSHLAFRVLEICEAERRAGTNIDSVAWLRKHKDLLCVAEAGEKYSNAAWKSIYRLLNVAYWTRVWTFQERILPCTAYLCRGTDIAPLDSLLWFAKWSTTCSPYSRPFFMDEKVWSMFMAKDQLRQVFGFNQILATLTLRITYHLSYINGATMLHSNVDGLCRCQGEKTRATLYNTDSYRKTEPLDLYNALQYVRRLRTSDPRDRIYGLLGIVKSSIIPNYALPPREIFISFASQAVKIIPSIILQNSCWIRSYSRGRIISSQPFIQLPSWVPAWDSRYCVKKTTPVLGPSNPSLFVDNKGISWPLSSVKPRVEKEKLYIQGISCDEISVTGNSPEEKPLSEQIHSCLNDIGWTATRNPEFPRLQALVRVLLHDRNLNNDTKLELGDGAIQLHTLALLNWLYLMQDDSLEEFLDNLGMAGFLHEENGPEAFRAQVLGEIDGREPRFKGELIKELLSVSQTLSSRTEMQMKNNERLQLFQTLNGHLGIGPRTMQPGDRVCVLFQCQRPSVLRPEGSHYLNIGPCFILGFMAGEAIRDMMNGLRDIQEFEIH